MTAIYLNHPLGLKWTSDQNVKEYIPIFGGFESAAGISLPKDAIFEIFRYLNEKDMFQAMRVSTIWELLLGVSLFDPRTGLNIFKTLHMPDPIFAPLEQLSITTGRPDRAIQLYCGIRLAKNRLSEMEYIWTTTNFMLKEIFIGNRSINSVKHETYPELFVKTINPARQRSVRLNWWIHSAAHSKMLKELRVEKK